MDPTSPERLEWLADRYPEMDLDLVRFFGRTMLTLHGIASMAEVYFARQGLSKGRFMVLIQLHADETPDGVNISELISRYHVSSATMTGIVDTLEKEGLIERLRCPSDRRRVNVRITPDGRAFMDEFLPRHHGFMKQFSENLSPTERLALPDLMMKLRQGFCSTLGCHTDNEREDRK